MSAEEGENEVPTRTLTFSDLPDDVLFAILAFCSFKTVLAVACVNRKLNRVADDNIVWKRIKGTFLHTNFDDERTIASWKEVCQVSHNWCRGLCKDRCVLKFKEKYMPWTSLLNKALFISQGNVIHMYQTHHQRKFPKRSIVRLIGHGEDVRRFVIQGGQLVSASMDKSIRIWNLPTASCQRVLQGHTSGVYCVDVADNVIVSGSRDKTVKVWSYYTGECLNTTQMHDHVWSVTANQHSRLLATGTAGYSRLMPALRLWDFSTGAFVSHLTSDTSDKLGAGVLGIKFETPMQILSCGYDTAVRLWDVRVKPSSCVCKWEDPHDNAVYCMESDEKWMIITGTNRYGVVRIWDKRMRKCVRSFFAGGLSCSPVYSLQFDRSQLFVALDGSLRILDFSV